MPRTRAPMGRSVCDFTHSEKQKKKVIACFFRVCRCFFFWLCDLDPFSLHPQSGTLGPKTHNTTSHSNVSLHLGLHFGRQIGRPIGRTSSTPNFFFTCFSFSFFFFSFPSFSMFPVFFFVSAFVFACVFAFSFALFVCICLC